jgi:CubicO group peptidase (beta-lactamase class C family)
MTARRRIVGLYATGKRHMTGSVAGGAAEFEARLASFVKDKRMYGAVAGVVHGGELAWAGGAGFADITAKRSPQPDTLCRIASITKTFTGTAIMQLRDAGKLDLDDPAVDWLPELKASGSPKTITRITVRQLLSHESGLIGDPPGTDWTLPVPVYEGLAERSLARAAGIITAVPPNTQQKYSNLGYQLLGEIVRRASGTDYPAYLRAHVLTPLGMTATAFEPLEPALAARRATGYDGRAFSDELSVAAAVPPLWAEGGLWSDVRDLARWISFQLGPYTDPPAAESPVLAAATLREMHKPRYLGDDGWTEAFGISWYAIRKDDVTWIQHSGSLDGFAADACFDRDHGVGAIALLNGAADAQDLAMDLADIARRLVQASPPAVRLPAPTPEQHKSLLGLYATADMTMLVRLEWRDGKLAFIEPGSTDKLTEIEPAGTPDTFKAAACNLLSGETVRFRRLASGRVDSAFVGSVTLLRLAPVPEDEVIATG